MYIYIYIIHYIYIYCVRLHQKNTLILSHHVTYLLLFIMFEFAMTQTRLTAHGSCATRSTSSQRVGNSKTTASLNAMIK